MTACIEKATEEKHTEGQLWSLASASVDLPELGIHHIAVTHVGGLEVRIMGQGVRGRYGWKWVTSRAYLCTQLFAAHDVDIYVLGINPIAAMRA